MFTVPVGLMECVYLYVQTHDYSQNIIFILKNLKKNIGTIPENIGKILGRVGKNTKVNVHRQVCCLKKIHSIRLYIGDQASIIHETSRKFKFYTIFL